MESQLGDPGGKSVEEGFDVLRMGTEHWRGDIAVGGEHVRLARQAAEWETDRPFVLSARQAERQAELLGELEVDVEEFGLQLDAAQVGVEMADVEAPVDRPLDLCPPLSAH